jgi:hypothetical protein
MPLKHLDWVVNPRGSRLVANPEHKRGEMADEI